MEPAARPLFHFPFPVLGGVVLTAASVLAQVLEFPVEVDVVDLVDLDPTDDAPQYTTPQNSSVPRECLRNAPWYTYCDDDFWSAAVQLALAFGACFVVVAAALIACRTMIRRVSSGPSRRGDGDTDSINSMQRWINERLRDRPPRYDEMLSAAATGASGSSSAPSSSSSSSTSSGTTRSTSTAVRAEPEKPPAYEVVVNETQRRARSGNRQAVPENVPPPPYSAMAMVLMGDSGSGFSNPCFVEDAGDPPPYSATCSAGSSSLSSPTSSSSSSDESTASMSSLTSLSTLSLSASAEDYVDNPHNLLTVSQAVAVRDMMLLAEAPSSSGADIFWTSLC